MEITESGPRYDRAFMVVGADGEFRTQRQRGFERLALVRPSLDLRAQVMTLSAEGFDDISIPLDPKVYGRVVTTNVWGDPAYGVLNVPASEWMSDFIGEDLGVIKTIGHRVFDRPQVPAGTKGSFADGSHLLGISSATLAELNASLAEPVGMDRFRPNLVFDGNSREENDWRVVKFGDVEALGVKPCERCSIVNVRQETGERTREVLAVLARNFRGAKGKPLFGENFIVRGSGVITIGDGVEVLERSEGGFGREY